MCITFIAFLMSRLVLSITVRLSGLLVKERLSTWTMAKSWFEITLLPPSHNLAFLVWFYPLSLLIWPPLTPDIYNTRQLTLQGQLMKIHHLSSPNAYDRRSATSAYPVTDFKVPLISSTGMIYMKWLRSRILRTRSAPYGTVIHGSMRHRGQWDKWLR